MVRMPENATSRRSRLSSRVRDFAVYIAIGVVLVMGVLWCSWHNIGGGDAIVRWGGLCAHSAIVFGFTISWRQKSERGIGFWLSLGGLAVLHSVLFALALLRAPEWRASWFVLMLPLEILLIGLILDSKWIVRPRRGRA